ncbi:winged helix-turn-helix domain-containing tetratricopeptide repeat protein [Castellaniella sp.]|uniref:winged helix-turn-helix domain-containing tetratricopeptide repeat protein n=1 Tax=Castellaniella sp. TaxID=1955812 RepID=UPI002AFF588D|nr:winged helix-turn-helix domain-containing tetratricopeptide repeat protein [Castellaniella sp.]
MQCVFADCALDLERRELHRASQLVATTPKVFDLLAYLISQRNRVVTRDELMEAVWGGRIVSESTVASHVNAARTVVGDDGQKQRIIRTIPRKGFRFVADIEMPCAPAPSVEPAAAGNMPPDDAGLRGKPSIAVLPFVNLSGSVECDYLADGVVEDIITALSRYRWLFVVARNSSFTYKHRIVDVKQVGRELGVRYVLEGSWRQAQNRVRISGHLIDTATGATHWADRFEGVLTNLFEFQDQIADSVVGAIAPQVERVEIVRARSKPTQNLNAYDYYLRGMAYLHRGTCDAVDQALPLFQQAYACDPDFASAYAMAAWCHCWRKVNDWMRDCPAETVEGVQLARRAAELGPYDAEVLTRCGHVLGHLAGDLVAGITLLEHAQRLNPNLASAWFLGAFCHLWHGQTEQAIEQFTRAMHLSPVDPELYRMQAGMSAANYFLGNFTEAETWARKSVQNMRNMVLSQAMLAASQAMLGKQAEAATSIKRLREIAPAVCLDVPFGWLPTQNHVNYGLMIEGLTKAGL